MRHSLLLYSVLIVIGSALAGCKRTKPKSSEISRDAAVGRLLIHLPSGLSPDEAEKLFQIEVEKLTGEDLRNRVNATLLQAHPEWHPGDVSIRAAHSRNDPKITVVGRAQDINCARAVVDTLMKEYSINFRNGTEIPQTVESTASAAEQSLKKAEFEWRTFTIEHPPSTIDAKISAARKRLGQLAVGRDYFEHQLADFAPLDLKTSIEKRQQFSTVPPGMPEEFTFVTHGAATESELAFLNSLKQSNQAAIKAAQSAAEAERLARTEAQKKELTAVVDLEKSALQDIEKLQMLKTRLERLKTTLSEAEKSYESAKSAERSIGSETAKKDQRTITASVIEPASLLSGSK